MPRRKYLNQYNHPTIKSISAKTVRTDSIGIAGYAALVQILEITQPYMVGEGREQICIGDNGYSELRLLPDGKNWMMTAIYDNHDKIIEWYFDVTRENGVDERGEPYADDLYLDAAVTPDGQVLIFDEDELAAALEQGKITQQDFDMAHDVLRHLIDSKILTVAHLETLSASLFALFK